MKLDVFLVLPSLGGTQYSASPSSSSLSNEEPSVTQPEEGGSMKLWLNVSSGSWWDTVGGLTGTCVTTYSQSLLSWSARDFALRLFVLEQQIRTSERTDQ